MICLRFQIFDCQLGEAVMNIYGTQGKLIKGDVGESLPCPSCGNLSQRNFGVLRYFHLYGIPLFSVTKKVGIECMQCRWVLLDKQIPEETRQEIDTKIFGKKYLPPLWS